MGKLYNIHFKNTTDPSPVGKGSLRTLPATTFFQQLQPLGNQFLVMLAGSVPNTAAILNDLKVR
jgi:hypothetical protein